MNREHFFNTSMYLNVAIVILIFILGLQTHLLSSQVGNLQESLRQHTNQQEWSTLSSQMNQLLQEERWVLEDHWSVSSIDPDQQIINLQYNWSLQEIAEDAEITLQLQTLNEDRKPVSSWKTIPTQTLGINSYQADIQVSPTNYYRVQVVSQGSMQQVSQNIYTPSYLHQPPGLTPSSASFNHQTEPAFAQGDVSIGFYLYPHDIAKEPYPSLDFIPEKVTAEILFTDQVFREELDLTEKEISHLPTDPADDRYREEWVLDFPAFTKGSFETLHLTIEYANGFVITKEYTHLLEDFSPPL